MSQGRRLAAIVAADVAGYSRLTGVDERLERSMLLPGIDPHISLMKRILWRTGW